MIISWKEGEQMYKSKTENVEVYFICYKKEEMELVETYYDEVLNTHYWYFNAYLAYKHWKKNFKDLKVKDATKRLLIIAASRYLLYKIENKEYKNKREHKRLIKDLKLIDPLLKEIIEENDVISDLN